MRVIGKNVLTLNDKISGSNISVYYTIPTTTQRIKYGSIHAGLKKGESYLPLWERVGRDCICGVADGDFGIDIKPLNGISVLNIDSSPSSKYYAEDWKDLLFGEEKNQDILIALGQFISDNMHTSQAKKKEQPTQTTPKLPEQ